jgi:LacI family transcriptional regulator
VGATIKDVARLAGCSIKTVSRVINGEPHVTEELRNRVQAVIRSSGYVPNILARRLVQQRSHMVCILMYPGFYQPASAVFSTIMDIGHDEDYDILVQPYFPGNSRSRNKLVNLSAEHRIDGFVTTPPCDADDFVADLLTTYKVPLVQINPIRRVETVPFVAGDDYQGAYAITEYLISLGHRRIAFLMGPRNLRATLDRFYGFRAALDRHQVPHQEELVGNSEFTFDGGYTAARLLLEQETRPTAIFAGNDEAAFGSLFAAQEQGLRIPAQLSVCGYDDLAFSRNIWPGLTTVHQPVEQIVEVATRMLITILKGEQPDRRELIVPPRLVVRGSSGPAP